MIHSADYRSRIGDEFHVRTGHNKSRLTGAKQGVALSRTEQQQRVPAATPRAPQLIGGLQHRDYAARFDLPVQFSSTSQGCLLGVDSVVRPEIDYAVNRPVTA